MKRLSKKEKEWRKAVKERSIKMPEGSPFEKAMKKFWESHEFRPDLDGDWHCKSENITIEDVYWYKQSCSDRVIPASHKIESQKLLKNLFGKRGRLEFFPESEE